MAVLPDWMIERDIKIDPFAPQQHRPGVISYGVTSYGYDVRVDRKFKVFTNVWGRAVDPKQFDPKSFVDIEADSILIPPNSFALAETVEYLEIPRDILCVCVGKSTYARCGIIVNVTPLEPEWRGRVTIEISNTTPLPAKIYAGEGIAQIIFLRAEGVCRTSYADKKGKYQDQAGLTLPFVPGSAPPAG
ncbi:MAG: dCTP deaminase [Gemmataceae bacterium]|nr:dCTP deaminase [Gemmataceae bacterium]